MLKSFFGIKISVLAESVKEDDSVFGCWFGTRKFWFPRYQFNVGHGKVLNLEFHFRIGVGQAKEVLKLSFELEEFVGIDKIRMLKISVLSTDFFAPIKEEVLEITLDIEE